MPQLDIYRACDEIFIVFFCIIVFYIITILIVIPLLIKRLGIMKMKYEKEKLEQFNFVLFTILNNNSYNKKNYIIKK